ncbi:ejaculatory bulb-specific protein 3-like [Zerene cesonia]|uniref:ejaculatory bulb-specific protein 3-like n=1 Tax=Zerene cesonia TaxID=33412 RepID=UPI0018E54172|nr:ejaculatory bulb-specific protein 3-like [Zerene cesonia]XP_038211136.1 ejaculatory bulb-specific protein 3-like [Zerene cesonia]
MTFVTLSLVVLLSTAVFGYDEKYSDIDVDSIIDDDELFMSYLNCFIDKVPCTAKHAEDYKGILPEVIKESCAKCTEDQKQNVRKIVNAVHEKKPEMAAALQAKFDPNHEYEKSFTAFLAGN